MQGKMSEKKFMHLGKMQTKKIHAQNEPHFDINYKPVLTLAPQIKIHSYRPDRYINYNFLL